MRESSANGHCLSEAPSSTLCREGKWQRAGGFAPTRRVPESSLAKWISATAVAGCPRLLAHAGQPTRHRCARSDCFCPDPRVE